MLSDSDERANAALLECLRSRTKEGLRTAYLWVHVIANHGEVHFYPTERTDIRSPEDELLGDPVWHVADIVEWEGQGMEFILSEGTLLTTPDSKERQRIIAAHVAQTVRATLLELPPEMRPGRGAVSSEWGEFECEWQAN